MDIGVILHLSLFVSSRITPYGLRAAEKVAGQMKLRH